MPSLTTWRAPAGTPDFIDFTGATWPDPTAGTGDTTTWTYDEATGLLTRKEYADGNGTDYTYDVANRLAVRTWARDLPGGTSGDRLDTTYSYSATTGELLTVDYEDPDTADITYTYDRLGRQATVADATGTRSFDYDTATLQLDTETLDATFYDGHELTRQYEDGTETNGLDGRDKGYTLYDGGQTSVSAATYGYDTTGRLKTVTDGTDTFTYAYETDSNLLASLTAPQHNVAYTYETNRDLMTVIDNRAGSTGVSPVSTYTYGHDELGRRNTRQQSGSAIATTNTDTFDYNTRSEVEGSTNSDTTNKGTAVWNPSYTYDQIGNRQSSTGFQPVSTYTTNAVNQYTALDSTSPIHDIDGNLTSDGGSWTYTWNNENRLSSATNGTVTIDFTYDYQGRLVKKDDGIDVSIYIYDGWNRIATFTPQVSSLSLQVSYLWGLDLSGSMQGAGGVGGLLKEGSNYCLYDANGNIMQKLDGTGAVVMNLDYDPFGNVIALKDANGIVDSNLEFVGEYGFSTKPLIDDLDWYYYGFRYYDPVTGRWPSRDPMGKQGGMNLYGFVGNEVTYAIDFLGLTKTCQSVSFSVSIPATKGKIRLAPPFYAKVGGSFSIAVEGEICDECCDGEMKETWEISATASGSVGITLGVGEDIDVSYGRNFSITGFAGAQASGTIGVSGGGSFGKSCDGTVTGTGSGSVSGDLGVRGGASLQATLRKGRWEWEFAKTSATISGTAGVSADYEFKCNTSGCSLEKFGDYSVNASVTAEACALGYCISHTF